MVMDNYQRSCQEHEIQGSQPGFTLITGIGRI